jgi:hypothetical protein
MSENNFAGSRPLDYSKSQIEKMKCKEHGRFMCCECAYGKMTVWCIHHKEDMVCSITEKKCHYDIDEIHLCDDFVEDDERYNGESPYEDND